MPTITGKVARSPSVLSSDLDKSVVMMDLEGGNYYDLGDSAATIWKLIEEPKTLDEICAELAIKYRTSAADCADDVSRFIAVLREKALVVIEP
tara:strand:+ start:1620 stop:1898 length:279 start_codon:yes stop_codon:yes gene_type:complete